jgi:hypothetical protein
MITSTIIVTFFSDVEAEKILRENKLYGTKVSNFRPRYTVEVPLGQEKRYLDLLKDLCQDVNEYFLSGKELIKRKPMARKNYENR